MDLKNISHLSSVTGYTLNTEEVCGLESSMLERRILEKLSGKVLFWGKIFGVSQDYLVVVNISTTSEFPVKKYYFWYDNYNSLKQIVSNFHFYSDLISVQLQTTT